MKWVKRLSVVAACLAVLVAVGLAFAWSMLRGRPEWYTEQHADPAAQHAAAARAEDEVKRTIDWAAAQQARERIRLQRPDPVPAATGPSDRSLTVRFTEQELNAAFLKWGSVYHWDEKYGQSISDPRIVLLDGRVIVAGSAKDFGAVVSLHFEPTVEKDGRVRFDLVRVLGGRLPLPQSMFDGYREKIEQKVRFALPGLQQGARIAPDGSANEKAVAAAMSKMLLRVLAREPGEAVLFLTANQGTQVPVKLTGVKIEGKSIVATVELMNAAERGALLERIREPEGPGSDLTAAAPEGPGPRQPGS